MRLSDPASMKGIINGANNMHRLLNTNPACDGATATE
jgi:hypothetical protein